jgi:hypothetical protein
LKEWLKENQNGKLKVFREQPKDDECLTININFIETLDEADCLLQVVDEVC